MIPTFQRRQQVLGAIDSALCQTVPPGEVLVVDDGSTDGTADAVSERFGDAVRLLRQPNRGPSAARNAAGDIAAGNAIAFLDSDDRWYSHHLAVVSELLVRHPDAVLVGTQSGFRFGTETPSDAEVGDRAEDMLLARILVGAPSSVAVRRQAFKAVGGFDEDLRYAEDDDLFIRLAFQGPFALISATTVEYGESSDSLERAGRRGGGYLGFFERTADRAMAVLEGCTRVDVEVLRRAARARRAIGAAIDALVEGQPVEIVRARLDDIRRLAPGVDAEAVVRYGAGVVVPRWYEQDQTARRLRAETVLGQAVEP